MAITRRSAVAKDQPQATPPPLPPLPPPPSAADITPHSNNINNEQPQQQQKQPQQKQQSAVVSAETVSNYEQTREQRMKENRERLQKLGIVDLALQLKSITATKRTPRRTQFDRKTPQKSPSLDTSERRRSSRLQNAPAVTYTELKEEKPKRGRDIVLEEGAKPEVYTEEHEKLLGNTEMPWTFFVDGYRADGTRIYDPISGKTCHQCRQKTLGQRTRCCKCNLVQGQFCGDCLMMRYGEHVVEANQNPDWICPPCRGICNCSLCRQAKGWYPTGALYKRISKLGYKSVAHYLITTKRAPPDAENSSDAPQLVKRSLPFEGMELPNDTGSDDKVAVENTDLNPHSENKAATFVEPDPKSEGVGRSRKRSKKENTDAGKESVTANEDSADSPVPNMNGPNSLTPSVRRSGRRSIQGNVDIGEMAVKTNEIPGEEPVSAIKDPNSSESKVDSIARRLRSRNKT